MNMTQRECFFRNLDEKVFRTLKNCLLGTTLACLTASPVLASDTRVALVPGGPHPYFAAWEKAGQDAKRDFGLSGADYRVPQKWGAQPTESVAGKPADPGLQRVPDLPWGSRGYELNCERIDRRKEHPSLPWLVV